MRPIFFVHSWFFFAVRGFIRDGDGGGDHSSSSTVSVVAVGSRSVVDRKQHIEQTKKKTSAQRKWHSQACAINNCNVYDIRISIIRC